MFSLEFNIETFLNDSHNSSFIFYPQKIKKPTELDPDCSILEITMKDGISIGGLFYLGESSQPTLLMFHGNGEIAMEYEDIIDRYLKCGVNCAIMDFRGYGFSDGRPTYLKLIQDSLPIYKNISQWLQNHKYSQRIILFGRSLGSVCAVEIASHNPPHLEGIVLESGFCDTYTLMRNLFMFNVPELTPEVIKPWSNKIRIQKIQVPALILHGAQDWIIPVTQANDIKVNLVKSSKISIKLIEHAGHNDIQGFRDQYFSTLKQFIISVSK
ncbi:2-succinyl-6-hydroxy-2,4-cyclohexadiene-1-carboxylate synthase [Candidatus Lokiarchaeum ossiferum]|uniref:2-succinyl-6-hydroxy-2, 4-cyclohexadiene-1-carboxylate synthase n=1 Tax=Candidatus Lokiarchaeum ossiferum TaxID=2951803 RepID=A0ABY6HQ65_9ARCH|nr:2-succinyl-6-hydroxy-2,4-cyclohexadiene-1-carboxylate synthase [Candidatus Lokiarchaeum sp. B-35]